MREFNSGARRDTNEDKGRMDLVPLSIIANTDLNDAVLFAFSKYQADGNKDHLYDILDMKMTLSDIIPLSQIYQRGAQKYGENNWKKGIPNDSLLDSAIRHYVKSRLNITDEPHHHMFLWNVIGLIWNLENGGVHNE